MPTLYRVLAMLAVMACGPQTPAVEQLPPAPAAAIAPATERADVPAPAAAAASRTYGPKTGFRTRDLLREHFAKHGREFGDITVTVYLAQAQALRDAPLSDRILELVRDDRVVSRFDRDSGSFIAFNLDGTIRTFFRPNDGERYFRRQARRRPIP